MLVATREVFLEKLLQLPALIDSYQRGDVDFAGRANTWLQELEQSLARLRSPLTSLASKQRARIVMALDGYRAPSLDDRRISRRKMINITASQALAEVETGLVAQVQGIDQKFDLWRDKLAQFISVASNVKPIPLPPTDPRRDWLQQLWNSWQTIEETRAMHSYLNTVMVPADRLHLFSELLENHLSGNGN